MFNNISSLNRTLLLTLFVLLITGCSKPTTLDGSSPEHFKESFIALTEDLPSKDRESLIEDLRLLNDEKGEEWSSSIDEPNLAFLAYLNGKSIQDIRNDAQAIRNAAAEKERQAAEKQRQAEIKKIKENLDSLRYEQMKALTKREELSKKSEALKQSYDPSPRSGVRIGPGLYAILSGQKEVEMQIEALNNQYEQIESQIQDSCVLLKNKYGEDC